MDSTPKQIPVTLESIAEQKAALKKQLNRQKETMTLLAQEIFAPLEPAKNKTNAVMRAFNTGMAIFDGVMMGMKLMRSFRKMFGRRR